MTGAFLLGVSFGFAVAAWAAWSAARAHRQCSILNGLVADMLRCQSQALIYLPVDVQGASLMLQQAGKLAAETHAELRKQGLWKS